VAAHAPYGIPAEATIHRLVCPTFKAAEDEVGEAGLVPPLQLDVLLPLAVLGVLYPPVPRELVEVAVRACKDEPRRDDVDSVLLTF